MCEKNDNGRYDRYLTGERICLGDRVAMRACGNTFETGRIVKHFCPGNEDPDAKNWGMEDGGIMIESDQGGWIGYGPADEELLLLSRCGVDAASPLADATKRVPPAAEDIKS